MCGIGFALGMERLALLMPAPEGEPRCEVYLAPLAAAGFDQALLVQRQLRAAGFSVLMDHEGKSFKARMKQADKLGARLTLILGDSELAKGVWAVRDMARSEQSEVEAARLLDHVKEKLHG